MKTANEAATGGRIESQVTDFDEAQANASIAACVEAFGKLDTLCNNAGVLGYHHTHEMDFAAWRKILSVNLDGTFLMTEPPFRTSSSRRGDREHRVDRRPLGPRLRRRLLRVEGRDPRVHPGDRGRVRGPRPARELDRPGVHQYRHDPTDPDARRGRFRPAEPALFLHGPTGPPSPT